MKSLIVEPEALIAWHMREELVALGYSVTETLATLEAGLSVLQYHPVDLVVISLPPNADRTLCKLISAVCPFSQILFLTTSSSTARQLQEWAATITSPVHCLVKPFSAQQFTHILTQVQEGAEPAKKRSPIVA